MYLAVEGNDLERDVFIVSSSSWSWSIDPCCLGCSESCLITCASEKQRPSHVLFSLVPPMITEMTIIKVSQGLRAGQEALLVSCLKR